MDSKVVAALVVVGALAVWGTWYLARAYGVWKRLHGERLVTCPETGLPAAVHIDVALAVAGTPGSAPPPLDGCSRWNERGPCDQPCAHAAQAPGRSAAAMVQAWAQGRGCVSCGGPVVEHGFLRHHIALYEPGGKSREWVDVATDRLPLALATTLPMCWNCHVAATFRELHPELVTDRDFTR